ncbi:hypothetical protein VOLCADRAFT_105789 [Volvox carteri f. nagariensis]|uniref:Uncharacterized protein n=1 Tax=Volvox carteri f. nagariensis TaxID=3068 RepID=D8U330_VOLCA|nr:uncharacterized protein VOLCADRAFT_105789 [Volvox carteri f. nagariensis]EFJ46004.1 hypothetical protein VOLCADRAFT_105789 [Volvox carteri f. nagariensis]|eukprot:XP_002953082.1 hypothetical protein VOLCADRAFT_105789 [Volvox carteri f. nagariensis]
MYIFLRCDNFEECAVDVTTSHSPHNPPLPNFTSRRAFDEEFEMGTAAAIFIKSYLLAQQQNAPTSASPNVIMPRQGYEAPFTFHVAFEVPPPSSPAAGPPPPPPVVCAVSDLHDPMVRSRA